MQTIGPRRNHTSAPQCTTALPRVAARRVVAAALTSCIGMIIAAATMAADAPGSRPGDAVNLYAADANTYAHTAGDGQIHVWHVQDRVWLLTGEPGESNVTVQVGDEGALVVDTGAQAMATKLLAQIQQLIQMHAGDLKRIQYVINTDGRADHIGGNQVIREAGDVVAAGNELGDNPGLLAGAQVIANQNVLNHLVLASTSGKAFLPQPLWPTNTLDFDLFNNHFNGEAVQLYHPHSATTDEQLMVLFRRSDVIAAGDIIDMRSYPRIDAAQGGSIDGELVALNKLVELTVPADNQEGGTVVIPGHGRLGDQSDVARYRNMVTFIRNRVQFYKNQGKTLQQVIALRPSEDYDARWGATEGPWTTRDVISAIYSTLPQKGPVFSMLDGVLVPAPSEVPGFRLSGVTLY